jgi:hypothetical protein
MDNYLAMHRYYTFHLSAKGTRTTVSLDPEMANYLAVSLGVTPGTPKAKAAIRAWADKALAEWTAFDPDLPLSAQVRRLAIRRIVDPRLKTEAE